MSRSTGPVRGGGAGSAGPVRPSSGVARSSWSIRPASALRMGILASPVAASDTAGGTAHAAAATVLQPPVPSMRALPWAGSVSGGAASFMSRHAGGGGGGQTHSTPALQERVLPAVARWVQQARTYLRQVTGGTNTGASASAAAGASSEASESSSPGASAAALQASVLSLTLRLLPNLAHHRLDVRSACAHLVLQLGDALDAAPVGAGPAVEALLRSRLTAAPAVAGGAAPPSSRAVQPSSDAGRSPSERHDVIVAALLAEPDPSLSLPAFFSMLGEGALAPLAPALIERLESTYLRADTPPLVRDVTLLVAACLLRDHSRTASAMQQAQRDSLALVAVWNIFFLLDLLSPTTEGPATTGRVGGAASTGAAAGAGAGAGSMARLGSSHRGSHSSYSWRSRPVSGGRVAVITALGMLAPIFVPTFHTGGSSAGAQGLGHGAAPSVVAGGGSGGGAALSMQILSRLLCLTEKSARETLAAKTAFLRIANQCITHARALEDGSVVHPHAADTGASRSTTPATAAVTSFASFSASVTASTSAPPSGAALAAAYSLYPLLLSLLSAHREEWHDLLGWAVFAYTANVQSAYWNVNIDASGAGTGAGAGAASAANAAHAGTTARVGSGLKHGTKRVGSAAAAAAAAAAAGQVRPLLSNPADVDALYVNAALPPPTTSSSSSSSLPLRLGASYPLNLLQPASAAAGSAPLSLSVSLPAELVSFLSSLEAHLRAPAPLVRLGAASVLRALLKVYPSILAWGQQADTDPAAAAAGGGGAGQAKLLYAHMVWGALDPDAQTGAAYRAMLGEVARGVGNDRVAGLIERYERRFEQGGRKRTRRDQRALPAAATAAAAPAVAPVAVAAAAAAAGHSRQNSLISAPSRPSTARASPVGAPADTAVALVVDADVDAGADVTLSQVVAAAASLAPAPPSRFLAFMLASSCSSLSSAPSFSASPSPSQSGALLAVLELVAAWARGLREAEGVFLDTIFPLLDYGGAAAGHFAEGEDGTDASAGASSPSPWASQISAAALSILRALPAPLLASMSDHHLSVLFASFQATLDAGARDAAATATAAAAASSSSSAAATGAGASDGRALDRSGESGGNEADFNGRNGASDGVGLFSHLAQDRLLFVLASLPLFPLERLPAARVSSIHAACTQLLFHPSASVRRGVYSMLSSPPCLRAWAALGQGVLVRVGAVLLAALGDVSSSNASRALDGLVRLIMQLNLSYAREENRDSAHDTLVALLRRLGAPISSPVVLERLAGAWDPLARLFGPHVPGEAGPLHMSLTQLRAAVLGEHMASFAARLWADLEGAAAATATTATGSVLDVSAGSSQRERSHGQTAQCPYWWALLSSHCGVLVRRRVPAMLLLPLLSSPVTDRQTRLAAAHTIKRCCVLSRAGASGGGGGGGGGGDAFSGAQVSVNDRLVLALVSSLPLMVSRGGFPAAGAFLLMSLLVPLRLGRFGALCALHFGPKATEMLGGRRAGAGVGAGAGAVSSRIAGGAAAAGAGELRRSALLFLEVVIMLHPRLCLPWLDTLRNQVRELLCHVQVHSASSAGGAGGGGATAPNSGGAPSSQLNLISRLYSLICHTASSYAPAGSGAGAGGSAEQEKAAEYLSYLRADLASLESASSGFGFGRGQGQGQDQEHETSGSYDPLLSQLSSAQLRLVSLVTIQAMGALQPTPTHAGSSSASGAGSSRVQLSRSVVEELVPLLTHPDAAHRFHALESLHPHLPALAPAAPAAVLARWVMLPLLLDPDLAVRASLSRAGPGLGLGLGTGTGSQHTGNGADANGLQQQYERQVVEQNPVLRRAQLLPPADDDELEAAAAAGLAVPATAASSAKGKLDLSTFELSASTPLDGRLIHALLERADTEEPWYALDSDSMLVPLGNSSSTGSDEAVGTGTGTGTGMIPPTAPSLGPALFLRMQALVRDWVALTPGRGGDKLDELVYLLSRQLRLRGIDAGAAVVLGELAAFLSDDPLEEGRSRSLLRTLLLHCECGVTARTRPIVYGCVLALQSLCCIDSPGGWINADSGGDADDDGAESQQPQPRGPLGVVFRHFGAGGLGVTEGRGTGGRIDGGAGLLLREGALLALRSIVSEPKLQHNFAPVSATANANANASAAATGAGVSREDLRGVTNKLMAILRADSSPSLSASFSSASSSSPLAKQIALEVLASLCAHVDPPALASLLAHLFDLLSHGGGRGSGGGGGSGADAMGTQLRRLFATLPPGHPLIDTFTSSLSGDLRSSLVARRLRALTTLAMLGSRLAPGVHQKSLLLLAADPVPIVRARAVAAMLQGGEGTRVGIGIGSATAGGSPSHHQLEHIALPVVKHMLGEASSSSTAKSRQHQRHQHVRSGSIARSPSPSPSPSTPSLSATLVVPVTVAPEDLSDQALLRLLDDVTEAFHRRMAAAAGAGAGAGPGLGAGVGPGAGSAAADGEVPNPPDDSTSSSGTLGLGLGVGLGAGVGGVASPLPSAPLLSIPLSDTDPFNVRYHRRAPYALYLRSYGLGEPAGLDQETLWQQKTKDGYAAFQQLTGSPAEHARPATAAAPVSDGDSPSSSSSSPTLLERLSSPARSQLVASLRALQVAQAGSDLSPLLAALIRRDGAKHAAVLLDELMRRFESLHAEKDEQQEGSKGASGSSSASSSAAAASGSGSLAPDVSLDVDLDVDIDMSSKLHTLGVALNLLQALCYSASPAASALPGCAAAGAVEREVLARKIAGALQSLQGCGSRFASHARLLRQRVLGAVSDLSTFRGPSSGTRWHVSARNERDWGRREHYQRTMMGVDERGAPLHPQQVDPTTTSSGGAAAAADGGAAAAADGAAASASGTDPLTGLPTTKQGLLEHARSLERSVAGWTAQLAHTTVLQTHVVRSVARLLVLQQAQAPDQGHAVGAAAAAASEAQIDPSTGAQSLLWLGSMFADQHRGVRRAVREAMVGAVGARCRSAVAVAVAEGSRVATAATAAAEDKSPFALLVQRFMFVLYRALKDGTAPLLDGSSGSVPQSSGGAVWMRRRPRADLVLLLAHLLPYATQAPVRADAVELLVALWDDTDRAVRAAAVAAVRRLLAAKQRLPEVAALAAPHDALKSAPLVRAILTRVRDPNYTDKEELNQLLSWYLVQ